MDGGDLDFIDFDLETGVVSIKLGGAVDKNVRNRRVKSIKWKNNANLFIFPNLDSANIGYKIMQRLSNDVVAIGPVSNKMFFS